MKESKSNVSNMYQTIPAVAALNRVPGFEPMKLLRPAKSRKTNEKVLKLALPYKKLWFRLAHPKGRIQINRLKLTEQIAIFEARVYLDRNDTEPISNFTASCIYDETQRNDYIKDAQEEAIDEALFIAGIGSQFADIGMTKEDERFGSEFPMSAVPVEKVEETALPISPDIQNMEAPREDALPVSPAEAAAGEDMKLPVEPVEQSQQQLSQPSHANEPRENLSATQRAMQILQGRGNIAKAAPATQSTTEAVIPEEGKEAVSLKYTKNTPVPEILKLMTLEEAQNVTVDVGTCVGRTIQEVANTRPAVLKYYQFGGYKGGNNILIAAATIMYNHLESQRLEKAG